MTNRETTIAELGRRHPATADDVDAVLAMPRSDAVNEGLLALAETIHKARWPDDRQMAITPFADEDSNGREYCFRIARAVAALRAVPSPDTVGVREAETLIARMALSMQCALTSEQSGPTAVEQENDLWKREMKTARAFIAAHTPPNRQQDQDETSVVTVAWDAGEHEGCGKDSERAFKAASLPSHLEQTTSGIIDWKMEAERANRLLADVERATIEGCAKHFALMQSDHMMSIEDIVAKIRTLNNSFDINDGDAK